MSYFYDGQPVVLPVQRPDLRTYIQNTSSIKSVHESMFDANAFYRVEHLLNKASLVEDWMLKRFDVDGFDNRVWDKDVYSIEWDEFDNLIKNTKGFDSSGWEGVFMSKERVILLREGYGQDAEHLNLVHERFHGYEIITEYGEGFGKFVTVREGIVRMPTHEYAIDNAKLFSDQNAVEEQNDYYAQAARDLFGRIYYALGDSSLSFEEYMSRIYKAFLTGENNDLPGITIPGHIKQILGHNLAKEISFMNEYEELDKLYV